MTRSDRLYKEAEQILVGGVNSPVRAFKVVERNPIFFKEGKGAYLLSEDGKSYVDYVQSFGPLILGHADEDVVRAITAAAEKGTSFGAPTSSETELAHLVKSFMPSLEKIRFVNSGTEACMSALRLARGYTSRKYIVKFDGCYHGHADSLLVAAGSGSLTLGVPDSKGILEDTAKYTIVVPYNDPEHLASVFKEKGHDIAGVIVEPVAGNMGLILPDKTFLDTLRSLCSDHGSVLIFDEVMSGFRVDLGGAQSLYGIQPDLTCLGKVIGGGLPCGAYGGKSEIMDHLSPIGEVYQAGTLSGNPLVMAAGIATLKKLKNSDIFETILASSRVLSEGIKSISASTNTRIHFSSLGSMFSLFFADGPIKNLSDAKKSDLSQFRKYFNSLLEYGIYMAPSQFETNFISFAHKEADIQKTLAAIENTFKNL